MDISIIKLTFLFFLPLVAKGLLFFTDGVLCYEKQHTEDVLIQFVSLCAYYISEFFVVTVLYFMTGEWLFCKDLTVLNNGLFVILIVLLIIFSFVYVCVFHETEGDSGILHCMILFLICGAFVLGSCAYIKNYVPENSNETQQVMVQQTIQENME